MKFERLNVPDWPLPDLVAFNRRVHERIDPWWRRRWVRWITWTLAGLFALVRRDVDLFRERPALVGEAAGLPAAAADQYSRL